MTEPSFRPVEILRALLDHEVEFVVIGGYGAYLQGSPIPTLDVDVTPSARRGNFERLAAALQELGARVYAPGIPGGLALDRSAEALERASVWKLLTVHGPLDLSIEPAGTAGYEDLRRSLVRVSIDDLDIPVASVEDIVRSKQAAGRPKDHAALPALHKLLERLDEQR